MPNNSSSKEVLVNRNIYNALDSDTVGLKIGCMTTVSNLRVSPSEESDEYIFLSSKIADKLLVPSNTYRPYLIKKDVIKLGPSVGILISAKSQDNSAIPKGKQGRLLKEMIEHGYQKGLFIFIFHPEGVNWKKKTVKGYSLSNTGKWIAGNYGFPTIIYNRIQYRSLESKSHVKLLLEKLGNEPDVFVFNSRFLNKWEVNEVLHTFAEGRKFIPETKKFNRENLRNMLKKHSEVFLKPISSSRGQGIVKIIATNNVYKYSKADASPLTWRSCSSFYILSEALSRIGVKENRYLIQQGIDLATVNDRVFDLRTQAQKDGTGRWIMTGVGARVAGKNRFVTHIPNGGHAASFEEVLKKTFGNMTPTRVSIEQQLKTICTVIPPKLEEGLGINLAIISLDIGVDKEGNLWILEVNSKPASFDEDDIRHKHLNYLTDYFIFAAQKIAKRDDL